MNKIDNLVKIIENSKYAVAFTGAGASTDSGLKSFKGEKDSLYNSLYKGYQPEMILSIDFFLKNKDIFYSYIKENLDIGDAKPNAGHLALAELEKMGKIKTVITQNIDGLHQAAGSKNVIELHGTLKKWHCIHCGKERNENFKCECGGAVKPNVVLYGEALDFDAVKSTIDEISKADTLIIIGSSLTVYPAASYIGYFKGKNLIIINKDETPFDDKPNLLIRDNFAKVFTEVMEKIKK